MRSKRLNILALIMFIINSLRSFALPLILLFFKIWFIPVAILILIVIPFIQYITFRYEIGEKELLIKKGWLFKKQFHVPYEQIQNVQRQQWFFLKPFHVEELVIDTGAKSEDKSKLALPAVNEKIGNLIEEKRRSNKAINVKHSDDSSKIKYQIKWSDMFIFAITNLNIVAELAIVYSFLERFQVDRFFGRYIDSVEERALHSGMLIIGSLVVIILLLMVANIIQCIIKYYHFTVERDVDKIKITRGLFQKRTLQFTTSRVQAVEFKQRLLRQLFHLTTVKLHLIIDHDSKDDHQEITLIPVINDSIVSKTVHQFISTIPYKKPNLQNGDFYSKWLFVRNGVLLSLIPLLPIFGLIYHFYTGMFIWIGSGIILGIVVLNGIYKGHYTGAQQLSSDTLLLRTAQLLTNKEMIVDWHSIQSMKLHRSILMKKTKRTHLDIMVRSGNDATLFTYRYLKATDAQAIFDWYCHFA